MENMYALEKIINYFRNKEQEQEPREQKGMVEMSGMVYVKRVTNAFDGAFFLVSKQPMICNPSDPFKFYLRVGGITCAEPNEVVGRQRRQIEDTFHNTHNQFGTYVFYSKGARRGVRKLRTIVCCRKSGYPDSINCYGAGILHSIYPRFDGDTGNIVVGVDINYGPITNRKWTRFDGKNRNLTENKGFAEIYENSNYGEIVRKYLQQNRENMIMERNTVFVIYVPKNTSLVMFDLVDLSLNSGVFRKRVNTLFQDGSIIIGGASLAFKFYDKDEGTLVSSFVITSYMNMMPNTKNIDKISKIGRVPIVIILKPTENGAFWSLRVPPNKTFDRKPITLCIPTGGEFEEVFDFEDGIKEIINRQLDYPWDKYIKPVDSIQRDNEFVDLTNDHRVYP